MEFSTWKEKKIYGNWLPGNGNVSSDKKLVFGDLRPCLTTVWFKYLWYVLVSLFLCYLLVLLVTPVGGNWLTSSSSILRDPIRSVSIDVVVGCVVFIGLPSIDILFVVTLPEIGDTPGDLALKLLLVNGVDGSS